MIGLKLKHHKKMIEKLKLIGCILLCVVGGFNIGLYTVVTKHKIISSWSPEGFIEPHRWGLTIFFLLFFIVLTHEQAKKIK